MRRLFLPHSSLLCCYCIWMSKVQSCVSTQKKIKITGESMYPSWQFVSAMYVMKIVCLVSILHLDIHTCIFCYFRLDINYVIFFIFCFASA
jgi:hypothetical protein